MQGASTTNQSPSPAEENSGWAKAIAIFTISMGLSVLAGWVWNIGVLKSPFPGMIVMKVNAATAFILSGICLYLHTLRQTSPTSLLFRRLGAALVMLIGLVTLSEDFFGWDAGIDQLLFLEPAGATLTVHPGRMAVIAATNFVLIGGALLLMEARLWMGVQAMASAVAIFALLSLGGYMIGNLSFTRIGNTTAIAVHAATGFLVLAVGVMIATQNHGFLLRLRGKSQALGLATSLVILISTFGAASYNFVQKGKASQWVEHTYQVIHGIELFSDSMHDFLYHNRGFLITGNDRQLEERDKRREAMLVVYANMRQLTTDNPVQHERLHALNELVEKRIERADLAVRVRREKGYEAAAAMVASGTGDASLDEIEAKLDELKNTELDLLGERQRVAEVISASSLFTLSVLLAASLLLLLWAFRASQREIVERKQSEALLRASKGQLRLLLDSAAEAIYGIDTQGNCTFCNPSCLRMLDYQHTDDLIGRNIHELIHFRHADGTPYPEKDCPIYRAFLTETSSHADNEVFWRADGTSFPIEYWSYPQVSGGKVVGAVVTFFDITERKRMEDEIAQREALFRNYFELGQIGMAITSLERGWLRVNNRLCEMLGYTREELNKMTWSELTYPDDLEPDLVQFRKLMSGEIERYSLDKRFIRKDGSLIHTYLAVSCQRKPDGSPDYFIASLQDITERKRAENELREKEERLALATLQNGVGVWDWNLVTQQLIWDDSMYALYRIRREDFIGTEEAWRAALHPDDLHRGDQEVNDAIAGIKPFNTEFRVVWPNGEIHHIKAVAKVFRDERGTPLRMLGINMDITERKQAETALRASEERLHAIIESSMDAIVQMDADGIITGWNSQMERVFGWARAEAIGRALHETIIPQQHRAAHIQGLQHFLHSGEGPVLNKRIEVTGLRRDGNLFPVELTITPIKREDRYEFSAFLRDITETKRAKEEIYRLNAELEQRVVERTAKLEAANKDMESFSYSISHDLRAPLRAINGFSRILQEDYVDKLDDEGRRLLNIVGANAQKMGELIDDILAFSRAGRNEIERTTIDMKNMAAGVWEELKPEMAGRNVQLELRDLPPAQGDAAMMHQVVFNLLANAVKFTKNKADARIEVGGKAGEHETVYHVKDNGAGFDMQYADKLFGVFLRLHGQDEFEGTGIGLAIVKRIITKHGGRVWAEGKLNEGATFYFALPSGKK